MLLCIEKVQTEGAVGQEINKNNRRSLWMIQGNAIFSPLGSVKFRENKNFRRTDVQNY